MMAKTCMIPDCGKPAWARGWCMSHYQRWRRHGDTSKRLRPANGEAQSYFRDVVMNYDGTECHKWPFATTDGRAVMLVDGRTCFVARLVCEAVRGPAPSDEHQAAHSCGNGDEACVTKRHLSWKTPSANQMDRVEHGTSNRGERCGSAKLTGADVLEIRASHGKVRQKVLAAKFGIKVKTVSAIQARRRWGWLTAA